jgi:hypothetical protein
MMEMQPGQSLAFSLDALGYGTLRTYASDLSFLYLRKYTTRRDRETRQIIVTREQ